MCTSESEWSARLITRDQQGRLIWVNSAWWEITKHDRTLPLREWSRLICEDDYSNLAREWLRCVEMNDRPLCSHNADLPATTLEHERCSSLTSSDSGASERADCVARLLTLPQSQAQGRNLHIIAFLTE